MPISTGNYTDSVSSEEEQIADSYKSLHSRYTTGDADYLKMQRDQEGAFKQGAASAAHGVQEGINSMANLPTDLMGFKQWADIDYIKPREGAVNEFISTGFTFASGLPAGGPIGKGALTLIQKAVKAGKAGKVAKETAKGRQTRASKLKEAALKGMAPSAGADFIAFSGNESLVYNLMEMHPQLQDAYGQITGKEGWENMSPSELVEATQGLGTFDAGRMVRNWGGRGLNVGEGAVVGSLLSVFWRAVKLKWNNDSLTKSTWEGKDESIKQGVSTTEKRHGKVLSKELTEKEKQEHLAFKSGPMVDKGNVTPEQKVKIKREEAELAAAQADLADKVDSTKSRTPFNDIEEDEMLAPKSLTEADEANTAVKLGLGDDAASVVIGKESYDYGADPEGMLDRATGEPIFSHVPEELGYGDMDRPMFKWGDFSEKWETGKGKDGKDKIGPSKEKFPSIEVNDDVIHNSWKNVIDHESRKGVSQPSVAGETGRLYALDAFNSYKDFEGFLIARQLAKHKFPKLVKESAAGYDNRLDRAAADAMKRKGLGNFWKYEMDALGGMEQFKVDEETLLSAIFKDPAGGKELAESIINARTGAGVDLNKAFLKAMDMINIDSTMSDAGQKYMTARVMSYFMKSLRSGFVDSSTDPLGNQFAKAIGWHGDVNRQSAKDHLHEHLLNQLDDVADATGLSPQGAAERIRKGYGDFKHLFDETSLDEALGQDVAVMREMYIRTWAYRLDQVITVKQLERTAEAIVKTEGKPSVSQLAEFATQMERMASKLAAFRNLRKAEGRALAANKAFRWAKDKGLGGGEQDQLLTEILNRSGGHDGLKDLAAKIASIADANKNDKTSIAATGGMVAKSITGVDVHNEYWMNAILSGARTQVVNTIGTALHMVYKPIEGIAGSLGGDETSRRFFRKHMMYAATMMLDTFRLLTKLGLNKAKAASGFQDAAAYSKNRSDIFSGGSQGAGAVAGARKALRRGKGTLESRSELFDLQPSSAITGDLLSETTSQWAKDLLDGIGNIIRVPSRLMISTDEMFKQISFRSASMAKLFNEAMETLPKAQQSQENIQKYMAERFQGLIRSNGARFTPDVIKDEAYRTYTRAVTQAEQDGTPLGEEFRNKKEYINNYIEDNYLSKADSHGALSDFAMDWSEDATFTRGLDVDLKRMQDKGYLQGDTSVSKDIQDFATKHSWARIVTPFIRTPINLLKFPMQRLPILHNAALKSESGWLKKLHQRYQADMMSNDPIKVAEAKGRMRMGALMYTTMGGLAASGIVTGGGSRDPQQRALDIATGWRPYSIKIGDKYISYQRLDPFSTVLGLAADTVEFAKEAGEHGDMDAAWYDTLISAGLYSASNNMANKSYLTGMSNFLSAITDPIDSSHFDSLIQKQGTSYVPKAISQFTVLTDDNYVRQTYGLLEAMQNQIPFMAGKLEPKRNILGQPMEYVSPDIMSRAFSIVNPFLTSDYKHDDVLDSIAGMDYNFGAPEPKLQGKKALDMRIFRDENGRSAYDFYQEEIGTITIGGATLRDRLKKYFSSSKFAKQTAFDAEHGFDMIEDDPRIKDIKYWIGRYRGAAKKATKLAYPDLAAAQKSYKRTRSELMNKFT